MKNGELAVNFGTSAFRFKPDGYTGIVLYYNWTADSTILSRPKFVHAPKELALPCASQSVETTLVGSRRLRSKLAAAPPVRFAHTVVTVAKYKENLSNLY